VHIAFCVVRTRAFEITPTFASCPRTLDNEGGKKEGATAESRTSITDY